MKKATLILFSTLLIVSCSGLLWNGDSSNELTLSINNPFYNASNLSESRALSLSGKFLYIELASIDDDGMYFDDFEKAVTGNGTWVETSWGGHAILTFDLNNWTESLKAVFTGIPKDKSLQARAFLETDESTFLANYDAYGESFPICNTYNESGFGPWGQFGVVVSVAELRQNLVILNLRPDIGVMQYYPPVFDNNTFITDPYIDLSTAAQTGSEPVLGATDFTQIRIDLDAVANYLVDATFYTSVQVDLPINGTPLPGYTALYNADGSLADTYGDAISLSPSYPYRTLFIAHPKMDGFYSNDKLFIGSSLFNGIELSEGFPIYSGGTYDVSYGLLYDNSSTLGAPSVGDVAWTLPTGVEESDLDFRILETVGLPTWTDVETMSQINTLIASGGIEVDSDSGWISGTGSLYDSGGTIESNSGQYIIILAKPAGLPENEAFIFARNANGV